MTRTLYRPTAVPTPLTAAVQRNCRHQDVLVQGPRRSRDDFTSRKHPGHFVVLALYCTTQKTCSWLGRQAERSSRPLTQMSPSAFHLPPSLTPSHLQCRWVNHSSWKVDEPNVIVPELETHTPYCYCEYSTLSSYFFFFHFFCLFLRSYTSLEATRSTQCAQWSQFAPSIFILKSNAR